MRARTCLALAVTAVAVAAAASSASTATADTTGSMSGAKAILWPTAGAPAAAPTPSPTSLASNLIFHGGAVEHTPKVFVTYWGTEWKNGFHTGPNNAYSNGTAMTYVNDFFTNVGGSPWNGTQTQYCDNIAPGSTSCDGNPLAQYITNPSKVLGGTWVDNTAAPATIVTSGLAENLTPGPDRDRGGPGRAALRLRAGRDVLRLHASGPHGHGIRLGVLRLPLRGDERRWPRHQVRLHAVHP